MSNKNISSIFPNTQFLLNVEELTQRMGNIRALLFDWDGVFNGGWKDMDGNSPFGETGSMGVNLIRFAIWKKHGSLPPTAVITGQHNPMAEKFAERERLHGLYMGFTDKRDAFDHFRAEHGLEREQVAFTFDDVLDISLARQVGLRVMVGNSASALLKEHATQHKDADIITANSGADNGLREACDIMMMLLGNPQECLEHRIAYDDTYEAFLKERQAVTPMVTRKKR